MILSGKNVLVEISRIVTWTKPIQGFTNKEYLYNVPHTNPFLIFKILGGVCIHKKGKQSNRLKC